MIVTATGFGDNMDEHLLRFDKDKTYVLIDCETENLCLNAMYNLPWQIAMIKTKGEKVLDSKDYYVKWDRPLHVSKEAARITKFNQKKYESSSVEYDEIFPTIFDWLENADYIMGHNLLGFDIYLIRDYYQKMGKPYHHLMDKILDTLAIARGLKSGIPYDAEQSLLEYQYRMINFRQRGMKTNLAQLGKDYDIDHDYDNLHNALVDLGLNLKVWNKLKWQVEI